MPIITAVGVGLLLLQYAYVFQVPFLNDDYIFLEKTRGTSFFGLWGFGDLSFHWYRPWSREFHYWLLQVLVGRWEPAYHLMSLALCAGVLGAYVAFAHRLAGLTIATVAAVGVVLMGAWAVPVLWVAGVQDLWLLLFCLLSLHAFARGNSVGSAIAFTLALASKETAAVLPAILVLYGRLVEARPFAEVLARLRYHGIPVGFWVLFHPLLGGRLWSAEAITKSEAVSRPLWEIEIRTLLSLVNLDRWPAPESGLVFLIKALPAAVIAGLLVLWVAKRRPPVFASVNNSRSGAHTSAEEVPVRWRRSLVLFAAGWALVGFLPLALPGLGWHAYYGLLGALGAWLAIAVGLARRPTLAIAVLMVSAILRSAQGDTASREWGTEFYQRRAAAFVRHMRADLLRKKPRVPRHSRLYFTAVPSNVGFLTQGGPSLRVWYDDPTLSGGLFRSYRSRGSREPSGSDYFFRYDSTTGWVEIAPGRGDVIGEREANPRWEEDQKELAAAMARAEDWVGTARQYEKLATAYPYNAEYALNVGVSYEMFGDSAKAARWYRVALKNPDAPVDVTDFATGFEQRWRERNEP